MKNKKIVTIITLIFITILIVLIFIDFETFKAEDKVSYYIDKETGVEYITFHNSITPRLDRNGKVVIKK